MLRLLVIALVVFDLTSSANAMTVIFKDYKAAANKDVNYPVRAHSERPTNWRTQ